MKRSTTIAIALSEPLSLREAKKHLEIADFEDAHDMEVRTMMAAARELWEHDTQSLVVEREVIEQMDQWPEDVRLLYRPVQITEVSYITGGTVTTLPTEQYSVDAVNQRIYFDDPPSIDEVWNAVKITYTSGKSSDISNHAIKLQLDAMFELRGKTKDKDKVIKAYEALVDRFQRSTYP